LNNRVNAYIAEMDSACTFCRMWLLFTLLSRLPMHCNFMKFFLDT
jgi:hypothetical protein